MTIIEAAAKAHWESDATNDRDPYYDEWRNLPEEYRELLCNQMRAALRAMAECEPTDAMREAYLDGPDTDSYRKQVGHAWRALLGAMVDE